MKTKNYFLVTLLIVLSLTVKANDNKEAKKRTTLEVVKQGSVFKLFYAKKTIDKVNVRIFDNSGKLIFSEIIKNQEGFIRPYNFDQLDFGDYRLTISDKDELIEKTIHHGEFDEIDTKPKYRLVKVNEMKDMDRVYKLTIVNQGDAEAYIKVKNMADEVIFSMTESFSGNYGKLFNLGKLHQKALLEVTLGSETTVFDL